MSAAYRMRDLAAGVFPDDARDICEQALCALEAQGRVPDIVRRVLVRVFSSSAHRAHQRALTLALLACCAGTGAIGAVHRAPSDIGISWLRVEEALEEWFIGDGSVEQTLLRVAAAASS